MYDSSQEALKRCFSGLKYNLKRKHARRDKQAPRALALSQGVDVPVIILYYTCCYQLLQLNFFENDLRIA